MADSVVNTVMNTTAQAAAGVVVGGVCEAVFPAAKQPAADGTGLLMVAAEVVAQCMVNAFGFMATAKLAYAANDQTGLLVYVYALFETQPALRHKVRYLGDYVTNIISPMRMKEIQNTPPGLTQSQRQKMMERY